MSDEIRPALTSEEWANLHPSQWTVEAMSGWLEQPIDEPHDFLAVAAKCLHALGYVTHEDVRALRDAQPAGSESYRGHDAEAEARLRGIADRIEALLPPRTETSEGP